MGTYSQQIGQSVKVKLLTQISKQLEKLTKVMKGGTPSGS
jgi:hypothetical protein